MKKVVEERVDNNHFLNEFSSYALNECDAKVYTLLSIFIYEEHTYSYNIYRSKNGKQKLGNYRKDPQ